MGWFGNRACSSAWMRQRTAFRQSPTGKLARIGVGSVIGRSACCGGPGLSMEQRYSEAAIEFERAIELDPTLFDARYYYGRACFKSGELEKSLRLFEQARSVRPEDYESVYLISVVLTQLGRPTRRVMHIKMRWTAR